MPDLLAGSTVRALDTPPTISDTEDGSFTFNATTFGIDADSGTYADCGVAFVACTTGRAMIHFAANMDNNTAAAFTIIAPHVRTGGTIGSGTDVVAASDGNAAAMSGTDTQQWGRHLFVSGLTPGNTYNVRLEHHVSAGIGTLSRRSVTVAPAT